MLILIFIVFMRKRTDINIGTFARTGSLLLRAVQNSFSYCLLFLSVLYVLYVMYALYHTFPILSIGFLQKNKKIFRNRIFLFRMHFYERSAFIFLLNVSDEIKINKTAHTTVTSNGIRNLSAPKISAIAERAVLVQ